ncbi:hypothetical protein [Pseudoalteromonas sp. MMG022]|uniref:hypothetical protein n=1 Tax=Pseudoalteromonas sp. MMG022 TaxID=2909978 RepID=UPI001F2C4319|nr:hypothetical protein [Pseudoalteromonas sp. MMG022]MCF6436377.1 hypothetical protein [Pseudoalteromonas sp. MMG022]
MYYLLNCFMLSLFWFHILKLRREVQTLSKLTKSQFQAMLNHADIEFPNEQLFDTHFKQRITSGLITNPKVYVIEKTGCSEAQADAFLNRFLNANSK